MQDLPSDNQETIDFADDPANLKPDPNLEESESQIAINMVLDLKNDIDNESRFWKGFAGICGIVVCFLAIAHFYHENLRTGAILEGGKISVDQLSGENARLKKDNAQMTKSNLLLNNGIQEFVLWKTQDNEKRNVQASPQLQALIRARANSHHSGSDFRPVIVKRN